MSRQLAQSGHANNCTTRKCASFGKAAGRLPDQSLLHPQNAACQRIACSSLGANMFSPPCRLETTKTPSVHDDVSRWHQECLSTVRESAHLGQLSALPSVSGLSTCQVLHNGWRRI